MLGKSVPISRPGDWNLTTWPYLSFTVANGVYRSRCWSLCCKLTVVYRDRNRF